MLRCGVVWCGAVWRGVVWCGGHLSADRPQVWLGEVWCGVVWCDGHLPADRPQARGQRRKASLRSDVSPRAQRAHNLP